MKFIKYLVFVALAVFSTASNSNAQASVKFLGGGILFQEFGAASQSIPGISCIWTSLPTPNIVAFDGRYATIPVQQGSIFVAWGPGTGTCAVPAGAFDVYSYMDLDSVVGVRCYLIIGPTGYGCNQTFSVSAGTAGANLIKLISVTDTPIPAAVISAIANQHFFVAGTDLRPEDAKFATERLLNLQTYPPASCGQLMARQFFNQDSYYTSALGYNMSGQDFYGQARVGVPVQGVATLGGGMVSIADFNLSGLFDPFSYGNAPASTVIPIGAKPIVVAVAPNTDTAGIAGATDINGFSLALFYQGVLARATDLLGPTSANPVNVFLSDPLAGDYNIFEYSIPNGTQYHASQDYQNCNTSNGQVLQNPLNIQSANGQVNAFRQRVVGTENMTNYLNLATTDTMGYFFWSPATAASLKNVKYLKVNGIDPIQDTYTNGTLPGSGGPGDPGLSAVTFSGVNSGNYPIWAVLRVITQNPTPVGVTNMLTALNSASFTQHDYISLANLKVWHSHFGLNNVQSLAGGNVALGANGATINPATPNDLCNPAAGATAEAGGDAGGAIISKQANADFCADFNNKTGLINKTQ